MNQPTVLSISAMGLGLILTCSGPVRADSQDPCVNDSLCREHEDRGIGFSIEKDYSSALVEFQTAYARAPIPRLLINIGRSLFRLGQPKEALKYYDRFSRAEPNAAPEITLKIQQYVAEAQAAIEATPSVAEHPSRRADPIPKPRPIDNRDRVTSVTTPPLVEVREPTIVSRPAKGFPRGTGVFLGVGAGLLIAGLGLGGGALAAAGQVTASAGPFDADLYNRGQMFNQAAIALDIIGGAALATGGIWLGVWLSQRKTTAVSSEPLHSVLATQGHWQ